jgi:L-amino acid N-acyltransferase YncA
MGLEGFPKQVTLKDGSHVRLVPLERTDSKALLDFYRAMPEEDRQVLKDDVTTHDWADRFLDKVERREIVSLIAKHGQKVLGEASLYRTLHGWSRHVGQLRLSVCRSHRRKHLGTELAKALVQIATDLGIEKIVVEVVENQVGARLTFEKLGFHKEAVLARHVMDLVGQKRDLLILSNDVSQIWAAMEAMVSDFAPHLGE